MPARIISLAQWKAAHPPALVCFQHGLALAVAWQKLLLNVWFNPRR